MFKKSIYTLIALLFLSVSTAQAGFLIEPILGYNMGSGDATCTSPCDTIELSASNVEFGGRLGYTIGLAGFDLMFGGQANMGSSETEFTVKAGSATGSATSDQSTLSYGAFVGFELPIMFRGWATYYLAVDATDGEDGDKSQTNISSGNVTYDNNDVLKGSGFGLGLGYTGLPFLSLNVEYRTYTFKKYTDASDSDTEKDLNTGDVSASDIVVSVSFPLNI